MAWKLSARASNGFRTREKLFSFVGVFILPLSFYYPFSCVFRVANTYATVTPPSVGFRANSVFFRELHAARDMPLLRDARPGNVAGADRRDIRRGNEGRGPTTVNATATATTTTAIETAATSGDNNGSGVAWPAKKLGAVAKAVAATVVVDKQAMARAHKDVRNGKSGARYFLHHSVSGWSITGKMQPGKMSVMMIGVKMFGQLTSDLFADGRFNSVIDRIKSFIEKKKRKKRYCSKPGKIYIMIRQWIKSGVI